jgi:hypothetical protein
VAILAIRRIADQKEERQEANRNVVMAMSGRRVPGPLPLLWERLSLVGSEMFLKRWTDPSYVELSGHASDKATYGAPGGI